MICPGITEGSNINSCYNAVRVKCMVVGDLLATHFSTASSQVSRKQGTIKEDSFCAIPSRTAGCTTAHHCHDQKKSCNFE